jgi:hypothetical protein
MILDKNNNIKIISNIFKASSLMGAIDYGYSIAEFDINSSNYEATLKKDVKIFDKYDFIFSGSSSNKAFVNSEGEYVLIALMAKGKYGYLRCPKIVKYNKNLDKIYEFTDTTSNYQEEHRHQLQPIEVLSDESFISIATLHDSDDSLLHVTLSKFDKLGHFQKSIEILTVVGDTITGDDDYKGIFLDPDAIVVQDNYIYVSFSKRYDKDDFTQISHPYIAKFDLDGKLIWQNEMFKDFSNNRTYSNRYFLEPNGDSLVLFGKKWSIEGENTASIQCPFVRIIDKNTGKQLNYIEFGDNYSFDYSHAIRTDDGGYMMVGLIRSKNSTSEEKDDNYTIKLDKDFKMMWSYKESANGETDKYSDAYDYVQKYDKDKYLVLGTMNRMTIGRFFSDKSAGGVEINNEQNAAYSIYRNNDETICKIDLKKGSNLTIELYNISGERLSAADYGFVSEGEAEYRIDDKALPSGVYFVAVNLNNSKFTMKYAK